MSNARRRRIEVEDVEGVAIATFVDKRILDEQNIQLVGEQLNSLVDDEGKHNILLNFTNVEYLSSAALGKLLILAKKIRAANGQLKMCNIKPEIYEVFEITKLNQVFAIYKDEEEALQAFQ